MISVKKILKIEVFCQDQRLVITSDDFTSTLVEDSKQTHLKIFLRGNVLKILSKNAKIEAIVYHINGNRMKYQTIVQKCTQNEIQFNLGEEHTILEDKRRYYKVNTNLQSQIIVVKYDGDDQFFPRSIDCKIKDINIGGILLETQTEFKEKDVLMVEFRILGEVVKLSALILRADKKEDIFFYGCKFVNVKSAQEAVIARYVRKVQQDTLQLLRDKINSRED